MFTGLVEAQGRVLEQSVADAGTRLIIESSFDDLVLGESIAVNGVCLTVLSTLNSGRLAFDVSPETLSLTNLGQLRVGAAVNLERAMQVGSRFGGHYVMGHIDTTAYLQSAIQVGDYMEWIVEGFSQHDLRYLLPKGSITLDGVSLTINAVEQQSIRIMLVPHTLSHTHFGEACIGQCLNVEFDYLTRIVAHQLGSQWGSGIMPLFLQETEVVQ